MGYIKGTDNKPRTVRNPLEDNVGDIGLDEITARTVDVSQTITADAITGNTITGNVTITENLVFPSTLPFLIVYPPNESIGNPGDIEGMVAFSSGYLYYCTASYDGSTDIWVRSQFDSTPW